MVNLRLKIILSTLIPLICGILLTISLSYVQIDQHSPSWMADTSSHMISAEKQSLELIAEQKATFLNEKFKQVRSDVLLLQAFATELFNKNMTVSFPTSYPGNIGWGEAQPGALTYDALRGATTNLDASMWYLPNATSISYPSVLDILDYTINPSANLDYVFKPISASNSAYIWTYMGFEDSGLYRMYPFSSSDSYLTNEIACPPFGFPEKRYKGYDPRCRGWYTAAKAAGDLIFTAPYLDITNGMLLITAAMPVYNSTSAGLIGVVAVDISISDLESDLLSTKLNSQGFVYLFDDQLNAVIHPKLDRTKSSQSILSLEFEELNVKGYYNSEKEKTDFQNSLIATPDSFVFEKGGAQWFGSFNIVSLPQFKLAIVVPESDVLKPSEVVQEDIQSLLSTQLTLNLVVFVVVFVLIIMFGIHFSRRIVKPISSLRDFCTSVKNGSLDIEVEEQPPLCLEMDALNKAFRSLLTALRFGNESFYANDIKKAKQCFSNALSMFSNMQNTKGVNVCHNNLGAICQRLNELDQSIEHYTIAIKSAEEELVKAAPDKLVALYTTLANRKSNLALVFMTQEKYKEAELLLNEALEIDRKCNNPLGFAIRSGNLGNLYLKTDRKDYSVSAFEQARNLVEDPNIQARISPDELESARSYAALNMGLAAKASNHPDYAIKCYAQALNYRLLDPNVKRTALKELYDIFNVYGDDATAKAILAYGKDSISSRSVSSQKDIVVALDYSGSMAGGRIKLSLQNLDVLWKNHINDQDNMGLIYFSDDVSLAFPLIPKGTNYSRIVNEINALSKPHGRTALMDALGHACDLIDNSDSSNTQFIVIITDGDDTDSKRFNAHSIIERIQKCSVNGIIIIPVGRDIQQKAFLEEVCAIKDQGMLISAERLDELEGAFQKVAELISGQAVLESY